MLGLCHELFSFLVECRFRIYPAAPWMDSEHVCKDGGFALARSVEGSQFRPMFAERATVLVARERRSLRPTKKSNKAMPRSTSGGAINARREVAKDPPSSIVANTGFAPSMSSTSTDVSAELMAAASVSIEGGPADRGRSVDTGEAN